MAHRYGEPIAVKVVRERPTAFTWRGRTYAVTVVGIWRLATGWWDPDHASDRTYYRVATSDHQIFELYYDAVPNAWVLDICQD
jgi:hypothetical protein